MAKDDDHTIFRDLRPKKGSSKQGSQHNRVKHPEQYKQRLDQIEILRTKHKATPVPPKKIGKKLPGLRKQRLNANEFRAGSLLLFFGIILIAMLYLISPWSKVKTITVTGNQQMTAAQVEQIAGVKTNDLMLQIWQQRGRIARAAERSDVQVKSMNISLTGPQQIQIKVTENQVVGSILENNKYYPVLTTGEVKKIAEPKTKYNALLFEGFKNSQILKTTVYQVQQLPANIRQNMFRIQYVSTTDYPQRLLISMNDGNEVYVKYSKLATKMEYYPAIATQMSANGVVDLQVGAYSYPYGTQESN